MKSFTRQHHRQPTAKTLSACIATLIASAALAGTAYAGMSSAPPDFRDDPAARIFPQRLTGLSVSARFQRSGAAITVTNCDDTGSGSLRAAIGASGDGDTVDLSVLQCSVVTLTSGAIAVKQANLQLVGPGAGALAIDGTASDRVFIHYGSGVLELDGLTIRNGRNRTTGFHVAGGGCIASAGGVSLQHSVVTGCYAGGEGAYGGAIFAGTLAMNASVISDSTAYGVLPDTGTAAFGGGAFVYALEMLDSNISGNQAMHKLDPPRTSYDIGGGVVTVQGGHVERSTVARNTTYGRAGGIASFAALSVIDSTVSGNLAESDGAGGLFVRSPGTLILANATVTDNAAITGGGVVLPSAGATVQSSIIYGNAAQSGGVGDVDTGTAALVGGADNIIGASAAAITLPLDTLHADPHLRPLADNGGSTLTHALPFDSVAIDRGNNAFVVTFDQRGPGFPRQVGSAVDIGAFEYSAAPVPDYVPVAGSSWWAMLLSAMGMAGLAMRDNSCRRAREA